MRKYSIEVTEVLTRIVEIEAINKTEAIRKAMAMYRNCEIVLDASDYESTKFNVKR